MKAKAEQKFVGELTDLAYEEMKLIESALEIIRDADPGEDDLDVTKKEQQLARKLLEELAPKLRESNWRE